LHPDQRVEQPRVGFRKTGQVDDDYLGLRNLLHENYDGAARRNSPMN